MFEFTLDGTAGTARAGTLTLPHGDVQTPAFMPVGTHGVVRGLSAADVRRTGAQIILGNTYHLHLRPGEEVVREMGGLHRFTTWDRPMLTDSGRLPGLLAGGPPEASRRRASTFQSHVDGTTRALTPERAMEIQRDLGADIAMAFDHVVPGQAPHELAQEGMERTLRWLERCRSSTRNWRGSGGAGPRRPSGPSSRAAPTTTCACARSRARWSGDPGPAWPSADSRSVSRSR